MRSNCMICHILIFQMDKEPSDCIRRAEHLYELYPSMPRYANDPEQSQIIKTYDFILRRFQGFYSKQPSYFVKAGTSPLLFGDQHPYSGYKFISLSSSQDIIVAVAQTSSGKIRINNYQSALYGEKVLSSTVGEWKYEEKEGNQKFIHGFTKILGVVAEEQGIKDMLGLDLLIYTGVIEDQFVGWKEGLYACFYVAITAVLTKNKPIPTSKITDLFKQLSKFGQQVIDQPQLTSYKYGHLSQHDPQSPHKKQIALPQNMSIVLAHSLTPLPKKLIQGKRFNLRRCEVLLALEYLKNSAGTTKDFTSLKQVQQFIGCTTQQLLKEVIDNLPSGKISSEQIQSFADRSLIDILKEVPYANSVIDQNKDFYPKDRTLFFLKEELLIEKLTSQNLVDSLKQSYNNQLSLLDINSQQIQQLIQVANPWVLAYKIIGNGWGGNILFLCQKSKTTKLVDQLISTFYLSEQNKVLLSDDLQQYIHVLDKPNTGLAILDPQSQIWF